METSMVKYLYIFVICVLFVMACTNDHYRTPAEFEYINLSDGEGRLKDSLIYDSVFQILRTHSIVPFREHRSFISPHDYRIGKILKSPDGDRSAAFLMVRKERLPSDTLEDRYDGTLYLCKNCTDSDTREFLWLSNPSVATGGSSYAQPMDLLEQMFLYYYADFDLAQAVHLCPYNLDDIRFWECEEWQSNSFESWLERKRKYDD